MQASHRKHMLLAAVMTTAGLFGGGCSMFSTDPDDEPLPQPAPARPTTVPATADTSTPAGLAREVFIDLPKRIADYASGSTATNAAIAMESTQPDKRRAGINDMVDRSFGKQAPYTNRYQQIGEYDSDPLVRAAAIRALNRSRDGSASKLFIDSLSDDNAAVRLEAAKALSNVPTEEAVPALLKLVNDSSEQIDVQIAAAEALRHYRSLEVARTLVNHLTDRDFGLAWQSRQSLRFMTGADQRYDQSAWLNYFMDPTNPLG